MCMYIYVFTYQYICTCSDPVCLSHASRDVPSRILHHYVDGSGTVAPSGIASPPSDRPPSGMITGLATVPAAVALALSLPVPTAPASGRTPSGIPPSGISSAPSAVALLVSPPVSRPVTAALAPTISAALPAAVPPAAIPSVPVAAPLVLAIPPPGRVHSAAPLHIMLPTQLRSAAPVPTTGITVPIRVTAPFPIAIASPVQFCTAATLLIAAQIRICIAASVAIAIFAPVSIAVATTVPIPVAAGAPSLAPTLLLTRSPIVAALSAAVVAAPVPPLAYETKIDAAVKTGRRRLRRPGLTANSRISSLCVCARVLI